ncbi:hypothetical protein RHGRI_016396 [Rhododendron griersonianum]|uniref:Uncharacterized protein n=1 Tax=Rhododendron griersonianum TaxID=479676 RepID=A0AAV6JU04_9ERIC|nr:hypothetical protein RHGRI_016396 [Rhododendron griersonianum]
MMKTGSGLHTAMALHDALLHGIDQIIVILSIGGTYLYMFFTLQNRHQPHTTL